MIFHVFHCVLYLYAALLESTESGEHLESSREIKMKTTGGLTTCLLELRPEIFICFLFNLILNHNFIHFKWKMYITSVMYSF